MTALILNSGRGSRMGSLTDEHPKCMTMISSDETILSRQLRLLAEAGVNDVVMTTGFSENILKSYADSIDSPLNIRYVHNPVFMDTNYIYSIYLAREHLNDDILLLHGDLVFEKSVLEEIFHSSKSCMAVSSELPLPKKDFKAVIENGRIVKVGIEFFENAAAAQPLYKLSEKDWRIWLDSIISFCESGDDSKRRCYAENAFNEVSDICRVFPLDTGLRLCTEIDDPADLERVSSLLKKGAL